VHEIVYSDDKAADDDADAAVDDICVQAVERLIQTRNFV